METAGEAERAALAVLGELAGCLSWPVGQNLAACLPRPVRRLLSRRSFESSMNRFSPPAFLKAAHFLRFQGVGAAARVEASVPKRFTRVDITNPRDARLIQQEIL